MFGGFALDQLEPHKAQRSLGGPGWPTSRQVLTTHYAAVPRVAFTPQLAL